MQLDVNKFVSFTTAPVAPPVAPTEAKPRPTTQGLAGGKAQKAKEAGMRSRFDPRGQRPSRPNHVRQTANAAAAPAGAKSSAELAAERRRRGAENLAKTRSEPLASSRTTRVTRSAVGWHACPLDGRG